jgi:RNA polymerase sigma factor for flagellar operon FliA
MLRADVDVVRDRSDGGSVPEATSELAERTTEELLEQFRRLGHTSLRDLVVERHRASVESMARGLAVRLPPSVDIQDLVHAGIWGLMQAISTYDPKLCDQFSAYMRIRVRGAMLDELRQMDLVPRLLRRQWKQREAALVKLRASLQREPSSAELAAELGWTEEELLRRQIAIPRSADQLGSAHADGDEGSPMDRLADDGLESPIEALSRRELLETIRQTLQPIEWKVLQLHYLEGLTGKQVARRLRLSAARICQIHVRVLERLKVQLAAEVAT